MARIDVLPSIDIIRGFKGILDFYTWKGLPCVRAWPKYRPARQTEASLTAALLFGAIIKAYSLLGDGALEAYRLDAADQPRTARDIMVTGIYGHLHEASMSEFLTLLQDAVAFLDDLQALRGALHSLDTDELVTRIEHSVLPDGASTAAAQATQLSALQKIDDLQDALESKGLDRLKVRGENQVFTYKDTLRIRDTAAPTFGYTQVVHAVAGELWTVTNVVAWDSTRALTAMSFEWRITGVSYVFHNELRAIATAEKVPWGGFQVGKLGDSLRIYFTGSQAADSCTICITGHRWTKET